MRYVYEDIYIWIRAMVGIYFTSTRFVESEVLGDIEEDKKGGKRWKREILLGRREGSLLRLIG
jgi:hypothetical protein